MRPAGRRVIIEWILKAWRDLPESLIKNLFEVCAASLPLDGSKDNKITCFKAGKPCEAGRAGLSRRMELMLDNTQYEDQFVVTEEDIRDAIPEEFMIDEKEEIDVVV